MYQQQAHYPPNYPPANSAIQPNSAQLAATPMAAPGHYPVAAAAAAQQHPMMSHRTAQARSMPTGHYLNGAALPDYNSGASTLANHQNFSAMQQPHPQRHNSGVAGSSDSLAGHYGQAMPPSSGHSSGLDVPQSPRHPPPYVNVLPKDLEDSHIRAYGLHDSNELVSLQIRSESFFDQGAFGTVFRARMIKDEKNIAGENRIVAVKMVLQDKRYRNRELPLMKGLSHPNIVTLFYYYYSAKSTDQRGDKCLNLVMEFMPHNVSHLIPRKTSKRDPNSIPITPLTSKLVLYQIFRALSYIHRNGICHRDIKPNNLLFNQETGVLKVCDFGSAKQLNAGERNVSYICARYYRAPELLFGATNYTNMIDLWSTGIVFSELLLGYPIFYDQNSGLDQLVNIISRLGTPTKEEIMAMNKDYVKYQLPAVPGIKLRDMFSPNIHEDALDLISQLFKYDPNQRIRPLHACAHPYFDELRDPTRKWVNGRDLPRLFDFTDFELEDVKNDEALLQKLLPGRAFSVSGSKTPGSGSPYQAE